MIIVSVAPELIESVLRSGNKIGKLIEVVEGLPYNAQLVDAKFEGGVVKLIFSQPNVPDTEWSEVKVIIKARPAITLEELEASKKKDHLNSGILVERMIG